MTLQDETTAPAEDVPEPPGRRRPRRGWAAVLTTLAALLVFAALVAPQELGQLSPAAFVRIPVEALVGAGLLLVLPPRPRRVFAAIAGALLGVLLIVRVIDMGFRSVLARPFDPVLDWSLFGNAAGFVTASSGPAGAGVASVLAAVAALAVVVLVMLAVVRLSRIVVRRRRTATRALVVATAGWLACAALGAQLVYPIPVASRSAASLAIQKAALVPVSLSDQQSFDAAFSAPDPFQATPPDQLLAGLRGKDVLLTFVESYGRSAIEDPGLAPTVDPVLDAGTRRLDAAGYHSRSAFLTSSTAGGGSWLAHASLLSGLWVTNQQRHDRVVESDHLTLSSAFQHAGWDTLAIMPGTSTDWPEQQFFGIDRVRDARTMGNQAKVFRGFATPDQYTYSEFQRDERARPGRGPLFAEIPTVTSHWPWAHIPRLVDWSAVKDGSVYDSQGGAGVPNDSVLFDPARARAGYRDSIAYSLESLISYVETYGDRNLVLIFLGDHQPSPIVTGQGASRDVPITIVARDPAVLNRISSWGWQDGLHPNPQAPVWRMDAFRNRFLTAFAH